MDMFSNHHVNKLPNWYLLCGSFTDKKVFDGYDDKYYVRDFLKFSALIGMQLMLSMTSDDLGDGFPPDQRLPKGGPFHLVTAAREITYGKLFALKASGASDYDLQIASFRKPIRYRDEEEIRLIFQIISGANMVYHVKKEPKIINIESIMTELDKLVSLT